MWKNFCVCTFYYILYIGKVCRSQLTSFSVNTLIIMSNHATDDACYGNLCFSIKKIALMSKFPI